MKLSRSSHTQSPLEARLLRNLLKRLFDISLRLFHFLVLVVAVARLVVLDQLVAAGELDESKGNWLLGSISHELVVDEFDGVFDEIEDFFLELVFHRFRAVVKNDDFQWLVTSLRSLDIAKAVVLNYSFSSD